MFADRLRELRKKHGLTQEQLARLIGVERSSIGKYEGKQGVIPSDDVKLRIAEYFHVSIDYLMGNTEISIPYDNITEAPMTAEEKQLLSDFRSLNKQGKEYITQQMAIATTIYKSASVSHVEEKIS